MFKILIKLYFGMQNTGIAGHLDYNLLDSSWSRLVSIKTFIRRHKNHGGGQRR